jgi:hypothetical protein
VVAYAAYACRSYLQILRKKKRKKQYRNMSMGLKKTYRQRLKRELREELAYLDE